MMKNPAQIAKKSAVAVDRATVPLEGKAKSASGQTDATLKVFAAIHDSKRFTTAAAHQAFAGVKRSK